MQEILQHNFRTATVVLLFVLVIPLVSSKSVSDTKQYELPSSSPMLLLLSVIIVTLLFVTLLVLCGGCTDMEVGTDDHPASRAAKTSGNCNFDPMITDPHTRTLYSSHAMQENDGSYNANANQPLPYGLNPGGVEVAQGFTGYQATDSYQHGVSEPPPPSYDESMSGGQLAGWSR